MNQKSLVSFFIKRFLRKTKYITPIFNETMSSLKARFWLSTQRDKLFYLLKLVKPVKALRPSQAKIEISLLVSHTDLPLLLVAIKTLFYFSKRRFYITVFGDGSLTDDDIVILKSFIRGVHLVTLKYANKKLKRILRGKKYCQEFRKKSCVSRRIVDLVSLAAKERILIMDSDLIFFKSPNRLIKWIESEEGKIIFMDDCASVFTISDIEAEKLFRRTLIPKLNSGLTGFPIKKVSLDFVENYLKTVSTIDLEHRPTVIEQTFYALLLSQEKKRKTVRLSNSYLVSLAKKRIKNLVCRHYVSPIRNLFYDDAIETLEKIRRLETH